MSEAEGRASQRARLRLLRKRLRKTRRRLRRKHSSSSSSSSAKRRGGGAAPATDILTDLNIIKHRTMVLSSIKRSPQWWGSSTPD